MGKFTASIVIPVYNKWELTRQCLKSLASTIDQATTQVIVVDNASTDATVKGCPFLGRTLFGQNFECIRNERNRNFAGACNQGASLAKGNYLVFLNNDTLARPGWLEPLLEDFSLFSNLGGTGAELFYPQEGFFGEEAQHLGVFVSPIMRFGHLYHGVSRKSTLAGKRRFFQVITGACLVMGRTLFLENGKFDEEYVNGFEDVDLCGRLCAKGFRFTVNPLSSLLHYEGQSQGRGARDKENYDRLFRTSLKYFRPDWQKLLQEDGFTLTLTPWQRLQPRLSPGLEEDLNKNLPQMPCPELIQALADYPYWQDGWEALLERTRDPALYLAVFKSYFNFFPILPNAARAIALGRENADSRLERLGKSRLESHATPPQIMLAQAREAARLFENNFPEMAEAYAKWIANFDYFRLNIYPEAQKKYFPQKNGSA